MPAQLLPCKACSSPAASSKSRSPRASPCVPTPPAADEAVEAGAAGLVYIRVKEGGAIEAAKPVMEGLSPEQQAAVVRQLQVGGLGAGGWQGGACDAVAGSCVH